MHYINVTEPSLEYLSRSVAHWFLDKFLPDFELDLDIIPLSFGSDEAMGWTLQLNNDEYEIEINSNLDEKEYITTLMHELVHVWQHVNGYQCEDEAYEMEKDLAEQYVTVHKLAHAS